jgi:hypothetical protein
MRSPACFFESKACLCGVQRPIRYRPSFVCSIPRNIVGRARSSGNEPRRLGTHCRSELCAGRGERQARSNAARRLSDHVPPDRILDLHNAWINSFLTRGPCIERCQVPVCHSDRHRDSLLYSHKQSPLQTRRLFLHCGWGKLIENRSSAQTWSNNCDENVRILVAIIRSCSEATSH